LRKNSNEDGKAARHVHVVSSRSRSAVAHLSADLEIISVSDEFADWLGVAERELVGKKLHLQIGGQVFSQMRIYFEDCLSGKTVGFRHAVPTGAGRRWTEFLLRPCSDRSGKSNGLYLVARDVHDEQQARLLLEGGQKHLALLTNSIPAPICSLDLEQRYTYANQNCLHVLGRSFDEIEGRTLQEILAPEDYALIQPYVERALRGETVSYERLLTMPDGVKRWMYINYVAIRDDGGRVTGVWAIFYDIDRLKHAEGDLQTAYRLLNTHVENTPLAVIEWDGEMRARRWSSQAEKLFYWQPEEVIGKPPEEFGFVFEADRDIVEAATARLRDGLEPRNSCVARHYRRDGTVIYCEWHSSAVFDDSGRLLSILTMLQDLSERKREEANLKHLATHDPLTGLLNRSAFAEHLECALARARREQGKVYMLFVDLDHFKAVNDKLGHQLGDELLQQTVFRLRSCLREVDILARLGGDEFTVILENVPDGMRVSTMAERILRALGEPFRLAQHSAVVSASIGISVFPENGKDSSELLRNADTAMYRAKKAGRNTYRFFTEQLSYHQRERLRLDRELRRALEEKQFYLEYQPKVSLLSGQITGVEALLRWRHPSLGEIAPERFLAVAEENGLMVPLGNWVIEAACAQAQQWRATGLPDIEMSINVSSMHFAHPDLVDSIADAMSHSGAMAGYRDFGIEITEGCLMSHGKKAVSRLRDLQQSQVKVAIDDFGTGYSSLAHLAHLPVDMLKIDKSFIGGLSQGNSAGSVVTSIIHLAHNLGMRVIAEGVEDQQQLEFLRQHGCDDCQGFLFGRPVAPDQIAKLLYQEGIAQSIPAAEKRAH